MLRPAFSLYREGLALVNGLLGEWLCRRGSPLALTMHLSGRPASADQCQRRLCVLIHGLTETSSIWDYPQRPDLDYGVLRAEFEGFSPLYLHYNSGLGLKENGRNLAIELEQLVQEWPRPIDQLVLLGHSMGGLIIRFACDHGRNVGTAWLEAVTDCIYLGTPHLGAPLARFTQSSALWLRNQKLAPLQVMGEFLDIRSTGICNLSTGCGSPLVSPTLIPGIRHFAVSGSVFSWSDPCTDEMPGDALVPRSSARGPDDTAWNLNGEAHFPGIGHLRLAHHCDVYRQIAEWCHYEVA